MFTLQFIFVFAVISVCSAWNQPELQMFDLIDELKVNFYDFLGVEQTALPDEIRKAYRKLSVQLHPDRNLNDPTASDKFRQLVGVYEVLKDAELREKYNDVLVNGLPDWRNAVFYYRKLRKMSNGELFTLFAVLATTIHYLVLWGSRYEKLWNMEEQLSTLYKRHKAKDKKLEAIEMEIAERLREIPKPKWHDLLPFAICKGAYYLVLCVPLLFNHIKTEFCTQINRFQEDRQVKLEIVEEQVMKERSKAEKQERKRRLLEKKRNEPCPYDIEILGDYITLSDLPQDASIQDTTQEKPNIKQEWTEDDISNLVRAVARFPGGVPERWTRIAEHVNRPVADVIAKAKQMGEKKMNFVYRETQVANEIPVFEVNENTVCGDDSDDEDVVNVMENQDRCEKSESVNYEGESAGMASFETMEKAVVADEPYVSRKKQKQQKKEMSSRKEVETRVLVDDSDGWTQVEQKQLEVAIRSIDKSTPERWDRIAECVPTKTKVEVMQRVKYLSNVVKTRSHRT